MCENVTLGNCFVLSALIMEGEGGGDMTDILSCLTIAILSISDWLV